MKYLIAIIISITGILQANAQNNQYPVPPKTKERLFYIQRNHNANTIVYDANFDENGNLIKSKPIDVYWIRYEEQGQRMELRTIEKWYAYGVECKKEDNETFIVELVADKNRMFKLRQTAPFKAIVTTKINQKEAVLNHMYIYAEETALWPSVKYIEFFGIDIQSGLKAYQKLLID